MEIDHNTQLYDLVTDKSLEAVDLNNYLRPRRDDIQLFDAEKIRQIEAQAFNLINSFDLMALAGHMSWQWIKRVVGMQKKPILILAGPGNNGGDAYIMARLAMLESQTITVLHLPNLQASAKDALRARAEFLENSGCEIVIQQISDLNDINLDNYSAIVDALFGIGLKKPISGVAEAMVNLCHLARLNNLPVLSLDIPSGLNADSGLIFGPTVQADFTLTFIAAKPGLFTADGPDYTGVVEVAPLNLDLNNILEKINSSSPLKEIGHKAFKVSLQSDQTLLTHLPKRPLNSHKGMFGDVIVFGGNSGMTGAAILAGRSALQMGAGRVYIGLINHCPRTLPYDPCQPELMISHADSLREHMGVWVIGPGMGTDQDSKELMQRLLEQAINNHLQNKLKQSNQFIIIFDADALSLLAENAELMKLYQLLDCIKIITPHPLEAARLLNCPVQAVQQQRIENAKRLAIDLDCIVVLKGQGTVIADCRQAFINITGNAALATAGTGDVLTGALAAFYANNLNGLKNADAYLNIAALTTFLHGLSAHALPTETNQPARLTATEVINRMRQCLSLLQTSHNLSKFN